MKSRVLVTILLIGVSIISCNGREITHEDIKDAMLSLVHMMRENTEKLERHEVRERQLGEQLKKTIGILTKKVSGIDGFKTQLTELEDKVTGIERVISQKDERERIQMQRTADTLERLENALNTWKDDLKEEIKQIHSKSAVPHSVNDKIITKLDKNEEFLKKQISESSRHLLDTLKEEMIKKDDRERNQIQKIEETLKHFENNLKLWKMDIKDEIEKAHSKSPISDSVTEKISTELNNNEEFLRQQISELGRDLLDKLKVEMSTKDDKEKNQMQRIEDILKDSVDDKILNKLDKNEEFLKQQILELRQVLLDPSKVTEISNKLDSIKNLFEKIDNLSNGTPDKSLGAMYDVNPVFEEQTRALMRLKELLEDTSHHIANLPKVNEEAALHNETRALLQEAKHALKDTFTRGVDDIENKMMEFKEESRNSINALRMELTNNADRINQELHDLGKGQSVMVSMADHVLDTKKRVEYGVHQILLEVGDLVKTQGTNINDTLNSRFDGISHDIMDNQNGALANLTTKMEQEMNQVWRQINVMYQQMMESAKALDKLHKQNEEYINDTTSTMGGMESKVGQITKRMSEVDENLNYLLGRLSLVTQEFNQIKTGLGAALDNIKNSFKEVQEKANDLSNPGPHPVPDHYKDLNESETKKPDELAMWGSTEESPSMEDKPPEMVTRVKETCEQNQNQLESLKEIMLRNKQSLKKKEEEVQEYARRLSKIKSRTKLSRRNREGGPTISSKDVTQKPVADGDVAENIEETIDDISQATTPKAKSSLLQKKLAENRKAFEQRNKEMIETKKAVEEKVEAIRQQLDEKELQKDSLTHLSVNPVMISSEITPSTHPESFRSKDTNTLELENKILELETIIIDLQENLKEKDSVIDSKVQAVTLMSADLSRKGKTTLDTLEETKDEMRLMQENFILIETSLKDKNDNLLKQLGERDDKIMDLERLIDGFEQRLQEQKLAESASVDFSRSTMDNLAETKDVMKSMQENFILIESTLKSKNDILLQQLLKRDEELTEANERISQLMSSPEIQELRLKLETLEQNNKQLNNEKDELLENISKMQTEMIYSQSVSSEDVFVEKDKKIVELECTVEEYLNKISHLENMVQLLETEKTSTDESTISKDQAQVVQLEKELDELNKSMIKMQTQHKNKLKKMQKQLEDFKKVSDTNAELVKLANQVTLLEEEKGNLQLSLVDFDEIKASAGEWQERIAHLENKVSMQTKELETHVESITILETQKLDIMKDLIAAKQEISSLEAANTESENLRVTAEMKIVDLEDQLETIKAQYHNVSKDSNMTEQQDLYKKMETPLNDNNKLTGFEEKGASDAGSTESFESIQEINRHELLKKIEDLSKKNNELVIKLNRIEDKNNLSVSSTESFETINDMDKHELSKKVEQLNQENNVLMMKLNRIEEKGSSDSGSTESFERIPEQNESSTRIDLLTQENHDLVIKLTKLEEQLSNLESSKIQNVLDSGSQTTASVMENEITNLVTQLNDLTEENSNLQKRIEILSLENNELISSDRKILEREKSTQLEDELSKNRDDDYDKLQSKVNVLEEENARFVGRLTEFEEFNTSLNNQLIELTQQKDELQSNLERIISKNDEEVDSPDYETQKENAVIVSLEREVNECKALISEQTNVIETIKIELNDKEAELLEKANQISQLENSSVEIQGLQRELESSLETIDSWKYKCEEVQKQMQILETNKISIEEKLDALQDENEKLIEELEKKRTDEHLLREEFQGTISELEKKLKDNVDIVLKKEEEISRLDQQLNLIDSDLREETMLTKKLQEELDNREILISTLKEEIDKLTKDFEKEMGSLQEKIQSSVSNEKYQELLDKFNHQYYENQMFTQSIEDTKIQLFDQFTVIEQLNSKVSEAESSKIQLEQILEEKSNLIVNLESNLDDAHRSLELTKVKHKEDANMQNQRIQTLIEELDVQVKDNETLKLELGRKDGFAKEHNSTMESKIETLEKQLLAYADAKESQFEKLKKIAATLKKKQETCKELEAKVAELQEKWITEKDEKEANNNRIQEFEHSMREKDNKIKELEKKLTQAENDLTQLTKELDSSKNHVSILQREMEELRVEIHEKSSEIYDILLEFKTYQEKVYQENEKQQIVLDETKENARELSVRMHVMETEYVEQLTTIRNLQAENGLLMSKETQICERFENVEKLSEDRRLIIEQMQTNIPETATTTSQTEDLTDVGQQQCDRCENLVQSFEATLQAREAELENLGNELANTRSASSDRSLEESYNELALNYNALIASNEEIQMKLNDVVKERHDLIAKIDDLRTLNTQLQQNIASFDSEDQSNTRELQEKNQELIYLNDHLKLEIESLRVQSNFVEDKSNKYDDNVPELFDSAKMFEMPTVVEVKDREEIEKLKSLVKEKESLCLILSEDNEKLKQILVEEKSQAKESYNELVLNNQQTGIELENVKGSLFEKSNQVDELIRELEKLKNESDVVGDLERRMSGMIQERDLLQLQVNDLTRALNEAKEIVKSEHIPKSELTKGEEKICDTLNEKIDVEEEMWNWSEEGASPGDNQMPISLIPSVEVQLQTKIDELEDHVKELEKEKIKMVEESKTMQLRSAKLVKKLKEYKIQIDNLQQQLKIQKSGLCELDSAIEDELKLQILNLEKALNELKSEHKKTLGEKDALLKRIDVLVSTNENHVQMKERQDMEMEVFRIQNQELTNKIQNLGQVSEGDPETSKSNYENIDRDESSGEQTNMQDLNEKYKTEIDDLKGQMDVLATENEQLQQYLEEQQMKISINSDSLTSLNKSKEEYDILRKQYEQSLMDANDQVTTMRQNNELLRNEMQSEINQLQEQLLSSTTQQNELKEKLDTLIQEKSNLEEKLTRLASTEQTLIEVTDLLNTRVQEVADLKQALRKQYLERDESDNELQKRLSEFEQLLNSKEEEIKQLNIHLSDQREEFMNKQILDNQELVQKDTIELSEKDNMINVDNLRQELSVLKQSLMDKDSLLESMEAEIFRNNEELVQKQSELNLYQSKIQEYVVEINNLHKDSQREIESLTLSLTAKEQELNEYKIMIEDLRNNIQVKTVALEQLRTELAAKNNELQEVLTKNSLEKNQHTEPSQESGRMIDGLPVFRMTDDVNREFELTIDKLKVEMEEKQHEVDNLKYVLSENTYPMLFQEMQETINCLYNEKSQLESSLKVTTTSLEEKHEEIRKLLMELEERQEPSSDKDFRDSEGVIELQNKLHLKEQEINELKYIINEKESQLNLQSNDLELDETLAKLTNELNTKEQEISELKKKFIQLEEENQGLLDFERISIESQEAIKNLSSEKEQIRIEAEERLTKILKEKEMEIHEIKNKLEEINLKARNDLENYNLDWQSKMDLKEEELFETKNHVMEMERRLAELSITKDTDLLNLKVQIEEKDNRIEQLLILSEEEKNQLNGLQQSLMQRETEIEFLKKLLESKVNEFDMIQNRLKKDVPIFETLSQESSVSTTSSGSEAPSHPYSNELDLALYMLHQRDVRCEELTHELMLLLEERDTLQLKLSNAIRVNEESRRGVSSSNNLSKDVPTVEPPVEHHLTEKLEGPIEIAKEALNTSIDDDKQILADKLSQLHNVGHIKDVRLRDDRELRHSQQMTLLAHKEALNNLPPEAAARLVNANHTLSRDVQSQSSVLLNWLRGNSTPKVVHM